MDEVNLDELATKPNTWLDASGPEADIVVSTRARLARNAAGHRFSTKATHKDKAEIETLASQKISELQDLNLHYVPLKEAPATDKLFLVERHLISKEHANADWPRGVAIAPESGISVMVNEEDHLRIQVLRSGFRLGEAEEAVYRVEDAIAKVLPFCFRPQFGYLTACPTNVGTGLRLSVLLHLPVLAMLNQIDQVFRVLSRLSYIVRGLYGEGTRASGDFYQISNHVTLGKSEQQTVAEMEKLIPQIVKFERECRVKLISENRTRLEDRVWRAFGILSNARAINSEETLEHLSAVRLGVNTGLIKRVPIGLVNDLFIATQPGHLQKLQNRMLSPAERDAVRADLIRRKLAECN
ncbi:MAG: protein arginine kinase [Planctomycetota bacterium]|nr:protein arginine kinase [Planctomycetota bacterium]